MNENLLHEAFLPLDIDMICLGTVARTIAEKAPERLYNLSYTLPHSKALQICHFRYYVPEYSVGVMSQCIGGGVLSMN